jgi:hypothetical protein
LQLQVPGGYDGSHALSGLQTVYSRDDAIGKIRGWRQIRQSLKLRRDRYKLFVEIVLDHGFLTYDLRGLAGDGFRLLEPILLAKTRVISGPPGIP